MKEQSSDKHYPPDIEDLVPFHCSPNVTNEMEDFPNDLNDVSNNTVNQSIEKSTTDIISSSIEVPQTLL